LPASRVRGRLELFGHESTEVEVELEARSRRWRMVRAAWTLGLGLVVAPVVGLIPPHAPWLIGALGIAILLASRRLRERHTLLSALGPCPRCGANLSLNGPTRLRHPHPAPCDSCHHESTLRVDAGLLPEAGDSAVGSA
jgi:hypothetical protein